MMLWIELIIQYFYLDTENEGYSFDGESSWFEVNGVTKLFNVVASLSNNDDSLRLLNFYSLVFDYVRETTPIDFKFYDHSIYVEYILLVRNSKTS